MTYSVLLQHSENSGVGGPCLILRTQVSQTLQTMSSGAVLLSALWLLSWTTLSTTSTTIRYILPFIELVKSTCSHKPVGHFHAGCSKAEGGIKFQFIDTQNNV